jgi:preprotein translocase subunit YajC
MVIAAGGIAGTIAGFDDKVGLVTLQIGGDIRIEVTRASVQSVWGSAPASGGEGGQRRSGRKRGGGR